jgi:hypothetical protein
MPYPFQYLINAPLAASTPGEVLRIPFAMVSWQASLSECIDWTSANITSRISASFGKAFFYIQCQYYPIFGATPPGNLLPPKFVTTRTEVCINPEWQSSTYNQTNELWQQYLGTTNEILDNKTRLVLLQGGYDDDVGSGLPNLTPSEDRQHSRLVVTAGKSAGYVE